MTVDVKQLLKNAKAGQNATTGVAKKLLESDKTPDVAAKMFMDVLMGQIANPVMVQALLTDLFKQVGEIKKTADPESAAMKLKEMWEQAVIELRMGPVRPATFIEVIEWPFETPHPRVEVVTPDGAHRHPILSPQVKLEDLQPGMTVFLDPEGAVVLAYSTMMPHVGQEAKFQRRLPDSNCVEVAIRDERVVLHAAQPLIDVIEADEIKRGDPVIFCPRREFAFQAVPNEENRKYRYVDESRIPSVDANRDIGKPHWSLAWLLRRTDLLLNRPDILETLDVRPRVGILMVGPSGTGKTLTIKGYLNRFHRMLQERTGRDDIGSRIVRIKAGEMLSPWFGETDQNFERLFNDVYEIGSTPERTADGEKIILPVVLLMEEIEGLARRRGADDGTGVYDRVIGTLLQRLDDPNDDLSQLPLIIIATSNRPSMIDIAMWRRLASVVARFTRLDRDGLTAVLGKKLKEHYPFVSRNGHSNKELRDALIDEVAATLCSPHGEDAIVEITIRDGSKIRKDRRHLLTGAVVEQAVSETIDRIAFQMAEHGREGVGMSAAMLIEALHRQVDNLADNITPQNAADFIDLPENANIAAIRRLRPRGGTFAGLMTE
ncbi:MAG: ATP-binding protein [Planctomycetes bacterium]|nr:ATP-binding protein [Planctomycetota bacterium]